MFLRPILYPRFPIWVIITAGGKKSKQFAWEKLLRLAFVSGNINPDKVYFFGISEGGYGSQRLASYYADYLAGAGPMAGGEPLKKCTCRKLPEYCLFFSDRSRRCRFLPE